MLLDSWTAAGAAISPRVRIEVMAYVHTRRKGPATEHYGAAGGLGHIAAGPARLSRQVGGLRGVRLYTTYVSIYITGLDSVSGPGVPLRRHYLEVLVIHNC